MPITTGDFAALTDDLQEVFNESSKTSIASSVGMQVFQVKMTTRLTYDYLIVHGLDVIKSVAEGSELPVASSDQGDTATWTQAYYGGIVAVTKKMRKFDLYDEIRGLVQSASEDAFDKIDTSLAEVLQNGWSTSYADVYGNSVTSTCPDSAAVFSASHSNGVSTSSSTFSNIITYNSGTNPALSREAIVAARVTAATYRDPEGLMRPVNLDTLLVPPTKTDLAQRIVNSPGVQGTSNIDTNPLRGVVKVKEWQRLESDRSGNSYSNYWFMYDSKKVKNSLKALFAEKPSMDAPEVVYKTKNWEYSIDFFYAIGRGYPNAVFGSKGDDS